MKWTGLQDAELAAMFEGAGGQSYEQALAESALVDDRTGHGFGFDYKQVLTELCKRQYSNEPETLNRLLAQIES